MMPKAKNGEGTGLRFSLGKAFKQNGPGYEATSGAPHTPRASRKITRLRSVPGQATERSEEMPRNRTRTLRG